MEAIKKWELWVTVVINTIAGLSVSNVIPETGKLHTASMVVSIALTNLVALAGRQVVRRRRTRKGDRKAAKK